MFNLINFAYLDPGTGSLIIQSVIGVIAGITVFGRNAMMQLRSRIKRQGKTEPEIEAQAETK
jgi:hypothetical protein